MIFKPISIRSLFCDFLNLVQESKLLRSHYKRTGPWSSLVRTKEQLFSLNPAGAFTADRLVWTKQCRFERALKRLVFLYCTSFFISCFCIMFDSPYIVTDYMLPLHLTTNNQPQTWDCTLEEKSRRLSLFPLKRPNLYDHVCVWGSPSQCPPLFNESCIPSSHVASCARLNWATVTKNGEVARRLFVHERSAVCLHKYDRTERKGVDTAQWWQFDFVS